MQRQFFAFHSTILHINRAQLFDARDNRRQGFESKFSEKFQGPDLHFREGTTQSRTHHNHRAP